MPTEPNAKPLAGRRVLITRPPHAACELIARLEQLGAAATCCAPFDTVPLGRFDLLDSALRQLRSGDWIAFTSAVPVRIVSQRLAALSREALWSQVQVAAIGAATASACSTAARAPDLIARESSSVGLASSLGVLPPGRLLYPCSAATDTQLARTLRERGWSVDQIVVYRTEPSRNAAALRDAVRHGAVDAIVFTSPNAVRITLCAGGQRALSGQTDRPCRVAIGPTTAAALSAVQSPIHAVAATPRPEDVADAVRRALGGAA